MVWPYILLFLTSCLLLFWAGSWLVGALMKLAKYLRWREFVVAFFVMAAACSLPNLFVGIGSALNNIPQLSFGDIVGGNVINLTLVVGLAVLIGKTTLPAESRMVQQSAIFATFAGILPLLLVLDGSLSRGDGLILIMSFCFYVWWLFSKEERFKKTYEQRGKRPSIWVFFKESFRVVFALAILLLASIGIVKSAVVFSGALHLPLAVIGILIVALGNTLPEIYFSIISARKGETWMILGDLIGSIIYTATLVLGIVALICPIKITDFSPFFLARIFLIISIFLFFLFIRTGQRITKKEGLILLIVYFLFVASEIFLR